MNAGRELDALVAERVMGRVGMRIDPKQRASDSLYDDDGILLQIAPYSTDIAAAWTVVEKLRADGWLWMLDTYVAPWAARVERDLTLPERHGEPHTFEADAETAPLAICRAALAAVGVEVPA